MLGLLKKMFLVLFAVLLSACCGKFNMQMDRNANINLYNKFFTGDYSEEKFKLLLDKGPLEKTFGAFFLRQIVANGLGGRQTDPVLASKYIEIMKSERLALEQYLLNKNLNPSEQIIYQTILAQIYYFLPDRDNNLEKIFNLTSKSACSGFCPAVNFLAYLNDQYYGQTVDFKKNTSLIDCANNGDPIAIVNLALINRRGINGKVNYLKASNLSRKAAGPPYNMSIAARQVAYYYENGLGVSQDFNESAIWLQKATKNSSKMSKHSQEKKIDFIEQKFIF